MATQCPKCNTENPDDSIYCGKCATSLTSDENAQASFTKTLLTPVDDLAKGTLFANRYEIIDELGKGGMGKVYKALDKEIHEEVAIKLLKPEIAADDKIIERFRNELKIARKITHENVCRTYDIGREEATPYITMEYVPGEDLKSLIKRKGPLQKEEALGIAKQVCEGLVVAHKLGVVHRDLKPQNIMIDKSGHAKIMDFGIARSVGAEGVTEAGMIIGTPDYISPEQADGEVADQRSDIYSLGVILYEMMTGTVPFKGDTALSVALKHKSEYPLDPRKLNPEVSDDLARLILICLEKERDRRYQSAEALLNDLRNIEEGLPLGTKIIPRRATFTQTLIRKKFFYPSLIFVLAIIAVSIWQFFHQGGAAYPPKIENSIAVINFENQAGEEEFDDLGISIPNLLMTSLEQTGFFHVVTWERMRELLKRKGEENVDIITSELGFQACLMEGVGAIVLGSYTKIGGTFVTDVKILDVATKRLLKAANSRGDGMNSIIDQIDELSKKISEGMGISIEKIEMAQTSIKDLTTSSIEAYNYYIRGVEEKYKLHSKEAIRFLEKAIELDPDFAMAYYQIGKGPFYGVDLPRNRKWYIEKAKDLSNRVSDKEKLFIEYQYAWRVERNSEKANNILKQLLEKYPREKDPHTTLGFWYWNQGLINEALEEFKKVVELDPQWGWGLIRVGARYRELGDFEKALEYAKKAASAEPGDPNPLDEMAQIYLQMGEIDKALVKLMEVLESPDWASEAELIAYVHALKENYPEALRWLDFYIDNAPTQKLKAEAYWWKGFYCGWLGNSTLLFNCLDKAVELAEESGHLPIKAYAEWLKGAVLLDRGEIESARKHFDIFLSSPSGRNPLRKSFSHGVMDFREGNIDSAKSRLKEMESILPEVTHPFWKRYVNYFYEFLKTDVRVFENAADEAVVASMKDSMPILPAWITAFSDDHAWYNFPFQKDMIARAYRREGELDKAIEWYKQHLSIDPETFDRRLIHPKYHYKLAVLYEEKGRKDKAIEQYEKFLEIWKDADPSHPEIGDAKKRLAGLKN
jgi:tetratricopeptide (TPR) repeat protein